MPDPGPQQLRVVADLQLTVGDMGASVSADGQRITIRTDDAGRLLAEATAAARFGPGPVASLPEMLQRSGRLLTEAGLSAQVTGRHGTVVRLGLDSGSRLGRVVPIWRNARLGDPGAVARAGLSYLAHAPAVRTRALSLVGGVAGGVLLVVGGREVRRLRRNGVARP